MESKIHRIWRSVTTGLTLDELWTQFKREAKTGYGLVLSEARTQGRPIPEQASRRKIFVAVVRAMLDRLTPARRFLLIASVVMVLLQFQVYSESHEGNFRFQIPPITIYLGIAGILVVLGLELADRVSLKRDLEIARDLQRLLVPESSPPLEGLDVAFFTRPANTVGGDYYDVFTRAGGRKALLVVADVAGKGIPAGLLMATLQASIHTLADNEDLTVDQLAARLNRYTCARSASGTRFVTGFIAEYDIATSTLSYVNAGHNAPILRARDGAVQRLEAGGLPFGVIPAAVYESAQTILNPGDVLTIFTDGVVEAVNEFDVEFGEERLFHLIEHAGTLSARDRIARITAAVDAFAAGAPQYDDLTCMVVRRE
jgi:hypothetical protein